MHSKRRNYRTKKSLDYRLMKEGTSKSELLCGSVVENNTSVTTDEAKAAALSATISSLSKESRDSFMPKVDREYFNNPDVDEAVKALQSSRLRNIAAHSFSKTVVTIPECVTQEFESYLSGHYKQYILRFSRNKNMKHNNAAALRRIHRFYMRDMVGYSKNAIVPEGYDMLLKDVGSSVYDVVNDELDNVHCCMPDLDYRDHIRHSRFRHWLFNHQCPMSSVHKKICVGMRNGSSLIRCESKAQDCYVKAPFLYFVHSAYDLSAVDMVDCMIAANATRAAAVFHFDDGILTGATTGSNEFLGYKWEIVVEKGRKLFVQTFMGDTQASYSHDLEVLIDKIFTKCVVGSDCYPYLFEIKEVMCGTMILEIFRRETKSIIGHRWRFSLPRVAPENTVTLLTWEYVLGYSKLFEDPKQPNESNMRPVTMVVPAKYFYDCYRYAATVDSSKFILQAISRGNIAIAARRNIGGTTMVDPEIPMPKTKQSLFNVTMYMLTFQDQWIASQGMVTMKKHVDQFRARSQRPTIVRAFLNCFQDNTERIHPHDQRDVDKVLSSPGVSRNTLKSEKFSLSQEDEKNLSTLEGLREYFENFARVHRKCPIVVYDNTHSLEYSVDIPDLNTNQVFALRDEFNIRSLCHVEDSGCDHDIEVPNAHCNQTLKIKNILGDGNCLYNCFVALNIFPNISVTELKRRLLNSPYFSSVAAVAAEVGDIEFVRSLNENGVFGNQNTLILIARTFALNICVHSVTESTHIYRLCSCPGKDYIHLHLENMHYDLLVPDIPVNNSNNVLVRDSDIVNVVYTKSRRQFEEQALVFMQSGDMLLYKSEFQSIPRNQLDSIFELSFLEILRSIDLLPHSYQKFLVMDPYRKGIIKPLCLWSSRADVVITRHFGEGFHQLKTGIDKIVDKGNELKQKFISDSAVHLYNVYDCILETDYKDKQFCLMSTLSELMKLPYQGGYTLTYSDLSRTPPAKFCASQSLKTSELERFNKIYLSWSCTTSDGVCIYRITHPDAMEESLFILSKLFQNIRFFRPTTRPNDIVDAFLICDGKIMNGLGSESFPSIVSGVYYNAASEYFCKNAFEYEDASVLVKTISGHLSGGKHCKKKTFYISNRAKFSSDLPVLAKLHSFVADQSTTYLCKNFKSVSLNLRVDDNLRFCSKPFELLDDNKCYHCNSSLYRRLLSSNVLSLETLDNGRTRSFVGIFGTCQAFPDIIDFLFKIVRESPKDLSVVSNSLFNTIILRSFCNFLRIYKYAHFSLCLYRGELAVRVDSYEKWREFEMEEFELIGSNRNDFDPIFLESLMETTILRGNDKPPTSAIRSKADVLRLKLSSKRENNTINTGNHFIPMNGLLIDRKPNDDRALFKKIRDIVVENADEVVDTSNADVEVAEEALPEPVIACERLKAVFEYRDYLTAEAMHSKDSISKAVDNILVFFSNRDPDFLMDCVFPNDSFIAREKKTRNKVGLFSARKGIMKQSEPMVIPDELRFVHDIVTNEIMPVEKFLKSRRATTLNRVAQYALFTNQVAHNQVQMMLDAINDVLQEKSINMFLNDVKISWKQSVAGSGKTTTLVADYNPDDLVVCPTVENRDSFRSRLRLKFPDLDEKSIDCRVRTLNGFLVDYRSKRSEVVTVSASRLLVDEAIMYHSGGILALSFLYNIKTIVCVGDRCQIPYTSRIDFELSKEKILNFVDEELEPMTWSYRNTPDTVCLMQKIYEPYLPKGIILECRSKNQNLDRSMEVRYIKPGHKFSSNILQEFFPSQNGLSFVENGKIRVKILFFVREDMYNFLLSRGDSDQKLGDFCCTVNQFQGVEAEFIVVMRLSHQAKSIYNAEDQCLVALTRHTRRMLYITVSSESDKLSGLINTHLDISDIRKHVRMSGGKTDGPEKYVTYMSIPTVQHMHGDNKTTIGFHDKSDIVLPKRSTVSTVYDIVSEYKDNHKCEKNVVLSAAVLDKFDQQRLKPMLSRIFETGTRFFSSGKTSVLNGTVYSVMEKNGIEHIPNVSFDVINDQTISDDFKFVEPIKTTEDINSMSEFKTYDIIGILQFVLSTMFPNSVYSLNYMDSWITYNMDMDLVIDDVSFSTIRFVTKDKRYDCMSPVLSFASPTVRQACLMESLIAVHKRNRNVPQLSSEVSDYKLADDMFEKFVDTYLDESFYEEIHYGPAEMADWLSGQKTQVMDQVIGEFNIYDVDIKSYNLITKSNPKPNLSDEASSEYAAPQVVIFQEKDRNAIFCPIFRSMKKILMKMIKNKKFLLFSDMDPDDVGEFMTQHHSTFMNSMYESLEIDMKKFDKSQDLKVLLLECKFLRYFKVPEEFVTLWYESHIESNVKDRLSSLKFKLQVQRRSGDGGTFIGNTIFLMSVLAYSFDMDKMEFAAFSGDDSLLVGEKKYLHCNSSIFSDLFNLDVKFFDKFEYYHFCSKFLIPVDDRWFFVPDPMKLLIRLSRCDLINWAHIEEYRISLTDSTKFYGDEQVVDILKLAVEERYGGTAYAFSEFIYAIRAIVMDKELFKTLYEEPVDKYPEFGVVAPSDR
nr:RNA-dependent RNA polymerase [Vinca ringspot virus]